MVRKGVGIIFLLVFAVFLILNFVSAGSCIGTFDCSSLDEYMCEYTSGCYWQGYCVGGTGYSGSPCGDEWDPYYCESMGCQWLGCTGTGSCSDFYYSASLCQSHSGCTWNSGCLYDTECPTGYYCTGTEYCTGTRLVKASWVDPTMPTNPESGVTRLVTPFQLNYNWVAGYEYYPKCVWTSGSPGIWDCGPCTYCGEARGNYVAYVVENLGNGLRWYRRDCVWTNVAGLCFNPRWAAGRLDSGPAWVASGYCSAYTPSNCVAQQGCYVVKNYGTCVSSCVPETNTAFCTRLGKNCGSVTANDNCGNSRTVASCGSCPTGYTCVLGTCRSSCTDTCSSLGYNCGTQTVCGVSTNCRSCPTGYTCVLGTCRSSCTDTCSSLGFNCGIQTVCGVSTNCGSCNDYNGCTIDSCSNGVCTYSTTIPTAACNDNNICTTDSCVSTGSTSYTCSFNPISNCCRFGYNIECNDNDPCTTNICSGAGGTCSYPSVGCTNGDGCCPSGCNLGDDNDCKVCTDSSQCSDNNACTTDTCSSGVCSNTPYNICNDGNVCTTDICTAPGICSHTLISGCGAPTLYCGDYSCNNGETCLTCPTDCGACPPTCGDGSCNGAETCSTCSSDCTWNHNTQECVAGVIVTRCDLKTASWNTTIAVAGNPVKLNITGTNCNGRAITFEIREKDGVGSDSVSPGPSSIVFPSSGTTAFGTWNAVYQDDGGIGNDGNPPEYYFIATVVGASPAESITSSNTGVNDPLLLTVYQQGDIDAMCTAINQCNNYITALECASDFCEVASQSVPITITCGNGYDCGCYWDNSKTPKCNAYWDVISIGKCSYTETGEDTCEDDGMLVRYLASLWTWSPENVLEPHYDPLGKSTECADIQDTLICPASVQIPFFGIYNFVSTLVIVMLVYYIIFLIKKRRTAIEKLKRKKRINKKDLDKLV